MASKETVERANRIITRLLWKGSTSPIEPRTKGPGKTPPPWWEPQADNEYRQEVWAKFPPEYRERLLASPMQQAYKELPRETVLKFITHTNAPTVEPTQKEWEEFENKLFATARRVAIRQVRSRFKKLSKEPAQPIKKERGRPKRNKRQVKIIQKTIAQWLDSKKCKTKTEAVKRAAEAFGDGKTPLHVDTIWRYLQAASQASRARPRSAKPSAR